MNTFQLECFIAVAEYMNFARAAEHLNVTQPSITHQIKTLESELNVTLFRRTTRTVSITAEGEALIADARNILLIEKRIKKRYLSSFDTDVERITLGMQDYLYMNHLVTAFTRLRQQHPHVMPEFKSAPGKYIYRLLEEESVDAIAAFKETKLNRVPGKYKELYKIPIMAVFSQNETGFRHGQCRLEDLKGIPLVLNNPLITPAPLNGIQDLLAAELSVEQIYSSHALEISLSMTRAGFGMTLLPDLMVPENGEFIRVPITDIPPLSFGLYYNSLKKNPLLLELISCCVEEVSVIDSCNR